MEEIGIYCTIARPGGGKSLYHAWLIRKLLTKEYPTRRRNYPELPERYILSNAHILAPEIFKPDFEYWTSASELRYCRRKNCFKGEATHNLHDCDIFIDEIANILPGEGWKDTPGWLRDVFSQHRKRGLRIFAASQDYTGMVDINFRRMVKHLYFVSIWFKSRDITATLPPPRWIHGVVFIREVDPIAAEHLGSSDPNLPEPEKQPFTFSWPKIFLLTNKLIEWYNTTQEFPRWKSQLMEELVQECIEGDKCQDPRHRKKITHKPI